MSQFFDEHVQDVIDCGHDAGAVGARERENEVIFNRHLDLWTEYPADHPGSYLMAFGQLPAGRGFLDIGSAGGGAFMGPAMEQRFEPPRVVSDVIAPFVPAGWEGRTMDGVDLLTTFGPAAFDMVQCCEAMEHMTAAKATDIAHQMIAVSRRYCFITSCGLAHHICPGTAASVQNNPAVAYQGQPDIEALMALGYTVRIANGYQIFAWLTKP
jgi:hypothetical protein